MKIYPYKFKPIYKEKIWGGRNLARLFGRQMPPGDIGESWELADLPESASVISNGPEAGKTITELTVALGGRLLGKAKAMSDGRFPLLLKLLDAEDNLSLQVHPDQKAVREIGPSAALKTECWYVLESRGGFIYKGVRPGVTAEQLHKAIGQDRAADVVRRIDVATGDFHYLPAGTVHALGRGVVVAEVQTPSDTTYRVSDWGRGRATHVELSLKCIRLELTGDDCAAGSPASDVLLETEHFIVARKAVAAGGEVAMPNGRCVAIMMLQGRATLGHDGKVQRDLPVSAGDTVLLPADLKAPRLSASADCSYLEITLPENK